jgi:hypothetical protein
MPNATGRFKAALADLTTVTQRQVDKARGLRELMGEQIILHATPNGDDRYLTAEVAGDSARLLRLVTGQHKVWWRRGELNPCPKIVNTPHLHV